MNEFEFTKVVNIAELTTEIQASDIKIAIGSIYTDGGVLFVSFKADLSELEQHTLIQVIDSHDSTIIDQPEAPQEVQLSKVSDLDNIPYVYATSKPLNHYVSFQGADDLEPTENDDGIGRGNKLTFRLSSKDREVTKDYTFSEDVYLKDGYIIARDAPFGATFDVDVVHPIYGPIQPFCRNVPIYGTSWLPLDTEDRALFMKGLILRITVRNSNGGSINSSDINESKYEDSPSTFSMFGRLELYRKKR